MIYIPGGTGQDGVRFHHITQNDAQFTTYKLFLSGIFYLIFQKFSCHQVTETMGGKNKKTKQTKKLWISSGSTVIKSRRMLSHLPKDYHCC